jgi:TonB family protein
MSRRWLVVVSVVAHAAVGVGLIAASVWRIERVEAGRMRVDLVRPLSPPEPAPGGPVAVRGPDFKPKEPKVIVKTPRQPEPTPQEPPVVAGGATGEGGQGQGTGNAENKGTCLENCGETPAAVPVCGDGSLDLGEQCDDSNAANGDGCSATCRTEIKPPGNVPPTVLQGLRISGETQVHPSTATQHQMLRNDDRQVRGAVKVCLATDGSVASATMFASTGYADYDATILSAVRGWRYRPYTVNGTPVPACSSVTFMYSIR